MSNLTDQQKEWIEKTISKLGLNEFGDPKGTVYMGGTPLFNEMTGKKLDRFEYIVRKHPDWLPQTKKD